MTYEASAQREEGRQVRRASAPRRDSRACSPAPPAGRLDSFFGPPKVVSSTVGKRKDAGPAAKPAAKKGKAGGVGKKK